MNTLVTGANGFVGRWLVLELSKQGKKIGACMRKADQRSTEFNRWIEDRGGQPDLITPIEFSLEASQNPWTGPLFSRVKDVFHTAALFKFGLTRQQAYDANVKGGLNVVRWTSTLPKLRRLVLLSGYRMVSDTFRHLKPLSSIPPKQLNALYKTHGAYEASKAEEYVCLRAEASRLQLPFTVVHPSTVIGHSNTGETNQFIGLAQTIQELSEGTLPALLGSERISLPLITVDYVAQFMAQLPALPETQSQEYCLLDQQTPKLHALLKLAGQQLNVKVPTLKLPIGLLKMLPKALLKEKKEALTFLTEETYDTHSADDLAQRFGLKKPPILHATRQWIHYLHTSQFGKITPHSHTNT